MTVSEHQVRLGCFPWDSVGREIQDALGTGQSRGVIHPNSQKQDPAPSPPTPPALHAVKVRRAAGQPFLPPWVQELSRGLARGAVQGHSQESCPESEAPRHWLELWPHHLLIPMQPPSRGPVPPGLDGGVIPKGSQPPTQDVLGTWLGGGRGN